MNGGMVQSYTTGGMVGWTYIGNNISNTATNISIDTRGYDEAENRKADMEETIAELEQENEDLRAQLFAAQLIIGRMVAGNMPDDEELQPHLLAVAGEFE